MRGGFAILVGLAAAIEPSSSFAMSGIDKARFGHCTVIGGENLPVTSGGSGSLCRAIESAISAQAPTVQHHVDVKVISRSRLSAVVVVNGRTLPDQRFAVMDGELTPGSFEHFAQSLALLVGQAEKK